MQRDDCRRARLEAERAFSESREVAALAKLDAAIVLSMTAAMLLIALVALN